MKLGIIGSGYVGLVTGTCLADLGNDVICLDIDKKKVDMLNKGKPHFYEPALEDMVSRNVKEGRLKFTTNSKEAIQNTDIIFICVGTPSSPDGSADLKYVLQAAEDIGKHMQDYKVVVMKSTVPVGTHDKLRRAIQENQKNKIDFDVVSNPEFLREGAAVKDFQNPDRIIIGTDSPKAAETMKRLYRPVSRATRPIMVTTPQNSELIKYASNSMLATRISFMNELSHLCEQVGADIKQVAKGMGLDSRIGPRFLQAGAGYGGSCFPKDVKALAYTLEQHGQTSNLLRAVDYINERQKKSLVPKLKKFLPDLEGKKIAVWGLAFKPRTSDVRESPALTVIEQLQTEYAKISAFDPEAIEDAKKEVKKVEFGENPYDVLKDADALIICTEWDAFRVPDFERMKQLMKQHIIIDGRNIYEPAEMEEHGFKYAGVGR